MVRIFILLIALSAQTAPAQSSGPFMGFGYDDYTAETVYENGNKLGYRNPSNPHYNAPLDSESATLFLILGAAGLLVAAYRRKQHTLEQQ